MSAWAAARPARPRRRWVWVSVALVTALVLVTPVAIRVGLQGEIRHQVAPVTLFRRSVSEVQVDAVGQSVTIVPGLAGQVTVVTSMSWLVRRPTVSHAWYGRILRVSAMCPKFNIFADCQASLLVRVPASITVRVVVGAGRVAVARLTGPVHLTASSGSIQLTDVSGPVWATAASGSISARSGLTSRQVDAAVGSGSVTLGFAAPPAALDLDVGSGSADVTVPPGAHYRISGERGLGSLTVAPGLRAASAPGVIVTKVGSGEVLIGYLTPAKPPPGPSAGA